MSRRTKVECHNWECGYVFNLGETPRGELIPYRDPYTGQDMRYTKCPKCGHRWYGYRRTPKVMGRGANFTGS